MGRRKLALDPCVDCGTDKSDMTCPLSHPLEELLEELADQGYDAQLDEIDARVARSPFCKCTNCGARGRFNYTGMKSARSYRAFWSCRACGHWVEV
jgi:hypothetical protein